MRPTRRAAALPVLALLLALLPAVGPAVAQTTFTVSANRITGVAATDDPVPDGVCDADCSLREAVQAANAAPGANTITFATAGTVALGRSGTESGNSTFNDLDVTGDLTVDGGGTVTINTDGLAGDDGRAFEVVGHSLTLTDLTIVRPADDGDAPEQGGGIRAADATLVVTGSTFDDLEALLGGAISADRSDTTITRSTFRDNSAFVIGAVSVGGGTVTIADSVIDGNNSLIEAVGITNADDDGDLPGTLVAEITNTSFTGNVGGGLYTGRATATEVRSSAFIGNNATGIYAQSSGQTLQVVNSTFSGNVGSGSRASAIVVRGAFPDDDKAPAPPGNLAVTVAFSTIAGNSGGPAAVDVAADSPDARIAFNSTILADNDGPNCEPSGILSAEFNLEDADDCGLDQTGDQVNTDPLLAVAADNGGAPQGADGQTIGLTRAIPQDSPALDNGDSSAGVCPNPLDVDQRGVVRPQFEGCDVGAFELGAGGTVEITKDVAPGTISPGGTATFTITVTNSSDSPVAAVGMTDDVPAGLAISGVTPSEQCPAPSGQQVTCDLGTLAPNQSATIGLVVTGVDPGNYVNTATATIGGEAVDNDDASLVVATGEGCSGTGTEGTGIAEGVTRIQGLNRIQTSIAASQAACGEGEAPAIVLTRSDLFPDAQAGTPLAVSLGAPLLLSSPDTLSAEAETEIQRVLQPGGTVYLLGGTAALSEAVDARIRGLGFVTVRYGGVNRFQTATIIADLGLNNPPTLLAANGGDFADSIVAGAAAVNIGEGGEVQAAVVLTSGGDVPPETQSYLDAQATAPTVIAVGALAGQAFPTVEQVGTDDRFQTSVAVATRFFDNPPIVGVARGDEFPDGLSGGSLVGRQAFGPGPILFTNTGDLPAVVADYLGTVAGSVTRALIFGGTAAINSDTEAAIRTALDRS